MSYGITSIVGAAATLAMAGAALAQAPAADKNPAEYVSIVQDITVAKPIDAVMKKVGGYCDLGAWFKTTCVYTVGKGDIGTNRLIGGRINEVMVARTATSYTYAQPLAPNSYHGTVEFQPDGKGTKIVYSLFYDASMLPDQAAKDKDVAGRKAMFGNVLKTMKAVAEAP
jgi:hypothetical protein